MKRNILFALSAIVLGTTGYVGYQRVSASSESDLFLANVEALSVGEKPKPTTYSSIHLPCYDYVDYGYGIMRVFNGKHSASCFTDPESNITVCHSHDCDDCDSDPGRD